MADKRGIKIKGLTHKIFVNLLMKRLLPYEPIIVAAFSKIKLNESLKILQLIIGLMACKCIEKEIMEGYKRQNYDKIETISIDLSIIWIPTMMKIFEHEVMKESNTHIKSY